MPGVERPVRKSGVILLAILVGTCIGLVDSSSGWDDTGVTVGMVVLAAGTLAFLRPRIAWWVGLAVGIPVVTWNVALHHNFSSAFAVVVSLVGAGAGKLLAETSGRGTDQAPRG